MLVSRIVVVVPCYNEEQRLRTDAFSAFLREHPDVGFLFVNDGSTDDTARVLQNLAQAHPGRAHVLALAKNSGKAEAVRQGLVAAMQQGATYVGYWDADLATPLDEIPAFVALLENNAACDLAMGARVKLLGRDIHRNPLRHYIGRVFATMASEVLALPVYDTQCGAKLMRATPRMQQVFAAPFSSRWIFDVELIARMSAQDQPGLPPLEKRIIEKPLRSWEDVKGSKLKPLDFLNGLRELFVIRWKYPQKTDGQRDSKPLVPLFVLTCMALLQLVLHVPMLHLPPVGQHVWRQVVGYAAARNYFQEDSRFFFPRADIRLSSGDTGAIYHELPITYWLTGKSYAWFGLQNVTPHLIPLLFNLILIPGTYYLGTALGYTRRRSLWLAFFMCFSPLYFYYAPSFEPNILGLSFFVWGLGLLIAASRGEQTSKRRAWRFATGSLMLTLGTLSKPTYLFFGLPLAGYALTSLIYDKRHRASLLAGYAWTGALVGFANLAVIKHAQALYDASPLQRQLHTPIGPAERPLGFADVWRNVQPAVSKWFVEMNTNLAALPFFLCGAYLLVRHRPWRTASGRFWLLWCASLAVFSYFFVMRFADHDYYITASLPLAAVVSSFGAEAWMKASSGKPKLRTIAAVLIVGMIAVATDRGYGRWVRHPQVPKSLVEQAEKISAVIPKDELVLVAGDPSPIVYLYYLQRKGLSINTMQGSLHDVDVEPFKWLVARQPESGMRSDVTERLNLTEAIRVDDFVVYSVSPRTASQATGSLGNF